MALFRLRMVTVDESQPSHDRDGRGCGENLADVSVSVFAAVLDVDQSLRFVYPGLHPVDGPDPFRCPPKVRPSRRAGTLDGHSYAGFIICPGLRNSIGLHC